MSGPYNTPNFALARTIDIATFAADASPLVSAPAAADIYTDARSQGEFGQLAAGKTLFFKVANGAILDTAAVVTYAVWTRANVVGTGNQWTLGQAPTTALAFASVSAPFRGDVFVQVLALSTSLVAGSVTVCVASALPGENSTLLQVVQPSGGLLHMVVDSGNVVVSQPVATRLQATVSGPGTAGTPTGGVMSIQGVPSGLAMPVSLAPMATDAFGRQRVSEPTTLFDGKFLYTKNPLTYDEITAAGAFSTGPGPTAFVQMNCATLGARIVRQSRKYLPYQPGKSFLVLMTGVLNASGMASGSRARLGIFDDTDDKTFAGSATGGNGFFWEQNGPTFGIVERAFVTGNQTTNFVRQSDFNVDRLDGTGPSRVNLDISKNNIYWWDFEWLGAGTVRQGVVVNGAFVIAHIWNHANLINTMYTQTMTLPVRYELAQTVQVPGGFNMKQGCATVQSEGGFNPRGEHFTVDRDIRLRTVGTSPTPLVSVRLRKEQNRGTILPEEASFLTVSNATVRTLVYYGIANQNPISLLGATFAGVSGSMAEYDIIASGFTGGYIVESNYLLGTTQGGVRSGNLETSDQVIVGASIAGEPDTLVLAAQAVTGTADMYATVHWKEYF